MGTVTLTETHTYEGKMRFVLGNDGGLTVYRGHAISLRFSKEECLEIQIVLGAQNMQRVYNEQFLDAVNAAQNYTISDPKIERNSGRWDWLLGRFWGR